SFFPQEQYERKIGGTHLVARKSPNGWGLYDMLGNVFEWCLDGFDAGFYAKSPRDDPVAPVEASAPRVVRGGAWSSIAHDVRAAYRLAFVPGCQLDSLGFRCAEFQSSGPAVAGSGWSEGVSAAERHAEHRSDREPTSDTRWPAWLGNGRDSLVVPSLTPLRISSDVEELVLDVMTRPHWASAFGRDPYGLWAEFTIGETVRQRLRWIPPGRSVMGSPPHEAGRAEGEGPQLTVRIAEGFWMFDTPCTQSI